MSSSASQQPLVYSCSGCSSAAQMANEIAVSLDRRGEAEMSCIAGVGGDVPSLVRIATSGRPIVAIDGCRLQCARACLQRHGVEPDLHVVLAEHGVAKRRHTDFAPEETRKLTHEVAGRIAERWPTKVAALTPRLPPQPLRWVGPDGRRAGPVTR